MVGTETTQWINGIMKTMGLEKRIPTVLFASQLSMMGYTPVFLD